MCSSRSIGSGSNPSPAASAAAAAAAAAASEAGAGAAKRPHVLAAVRTGHGPGHGDGELRHGAAPVAPRLTLRFLRQRLALWRRGWQCVAFGPGEAARHLRGRRPRTTSGESPRDVFRGRRHRGHPSGPHPAAALAGLQTAALAPARRQGEGVLHRRGASAATPPATAGWGVPGAAVAGHGVVLPAPQLLREAPQERRWQGVGVQRLHGGGQHELQGVRLLPALLAQGEALHGLWRGCELLFADVGEASGGRTAAAGLLGAAAILPHARELREADEGRQPEVLGLHQLRPAGHHELLEFRTLPPLLGEGYAVHDLRFPRAGGWPLRAAEHLEPRLWLLRQAAVSREGSQ
mmetsp:Transcript_54150/g.175983  ORF Transcript_54150/g.175983 Transcript_54150/m.175983 type:complete len:349 (-) Transcript_54150:1347-2393(-)